MQMVSEPPKYTVHDSATKNQLIRAVKAGKSITQAAELIDMPTSTARKIVQKFCKTGTTSNQPRSGRPQKLTDTAKRALVRNVVKERRKPFCELANTAADAISDATVRSVLAGAGYHWRVAKMVPYLSKDQRKARLRWARMYRAWKEEEWGQIFSDESYIYLGNNHGHIFVTRRADEVMEDNCLVPSFKQSSVRIMVWECIISSHKGPLITLEYPGGKGGGMNLPRYQTQALEGGLLDFYAFMKALKGSVLFQQDNTSSHKSKSTKKWLTRHHIPLLFHPPSSPDLNPIEPAWHELKTRLRALPHPPNIVDALKHAVQQAWNELLLDDIEKHIRGMLDRVNAVLEAKGGHTRF